MENNIVQRASFIIATQTGIFADTEAVKIGFRGLAFQTAIYHESADGDVSVAYAAAEGFVHCLRVVHLAVAYTALQATEPVAAAVGILDELFGGDKLDAIIHHVAPSHFLRVGMFAQQLQLRSQGTKGRFHAIAFAQPHGGNLAKQVEKKFDFSFARMAIFGTEVVDGIKVVLVLYDGLGIE